MARTLAAQSGTAYSTAATALPAPMEVPGTVTVKTCQLFIGGQWVDSAPRATLGVIEDDTYVKNITINTGI
jgi:hypothetical protein